MILDEYNSILTEISAGLDYAVDVRPKAGIEVKRVPEFKKEGSASAYYYRPAMDGSRGGTFYANLRDVEETVKFGMKTLAYHEGIPGHHFQIAIQSELEGVPIFRTIGLFTAYIEGWALYAEQLAWELGFYKNDPFILFFSVPCRTKEIFITLCHKVLFMNSEEKYIKEITEIRSMMERSTKFLSLSGLSGIMVGIYALVGAYIAYRLFYVENGSLLYNIIDRQEMTAEVENLIILALVILVLAVGTVIVLSLKKSQKDGEKLWNPAARRAVVNMAIPLVTGGIFILILLSNGLYGFLAPATLLFYGLALVNASKFTFEELRSLGIVQILLGLLASYFIGYGLLFWALGFGLMHIVYGIVMHVKYEK
ncbi:hypothetical protein GILI108418_05880 [Gillisia limnaea]